MNILTTGRLGEAFYDYIKSDHPELEVSYVKTLSQQDIDWADCLAAFPISEDVELSNIKWIHTFGAGVEPYLQRSDLHKEVVITRTIGNLGSMMGEYCLCHLLNFKQNTFSVLRNQRKALWTPIYPTSIKNQNVIILGTGEMAKGIARVLKKNGIKLIGVNSSGNQTSDLFEQFISFKDLSSISPDTTIINTLPLSDKTNQLLNLNFFKQFKNALFINVGRGKSVVTEDLVEAINLSYIAFAVLDVFEQEPLAKDSLLWANEKLFISPHQAALTDLEDLKESFSSVLKSLKSGESNALIIDKEKGY